MAFEDEAPVPGLWLARLRSFSPDAPHLGRPSCVEQEQDRILRQKMRRVVEDEEWFVPPHVALIVCTTQSGLTAAHEVFAGKDAVILLDEQRDLWVDLLLDDSSEERVFASWTLCEGLLRDDPFCEDADSIRRQFPIPAGSSYWTVTEAFSTGPLAGSGEVELWSWDGRRAERLGVVESWIS